ncbi:MAG: DUF4031 domain-containing protein, partial [Nocardioidaceae bacterium]
MSDSSLTELHAFAAAHGVPRRGFERDHYDVPAETYGLLVSVGASPVSAREVVRRLEASGLRKRKATAMAPRAPGNQLLRPRRLVPGDLVAVPATAGVVPAEQVQPGVKRLESWGLRVQLSEHLLTKHSTLPYLAGSDELRAAEFTSAWMDPAVSGVMLARGGYGTQRMLDLLDWKQLAEAEPKVLVGFSDVTALHQAIAAWLGLVTVHSHVLTSLGRATEPSSEGLRALLMEPDTVVDLLAREPPGDPVAVLSRGQADGVLLGGNVSMLAAGIGTRPTRVARGGIAILEDVTEDVYRLDRMLTQLIRTGWFEGIAGIVAGKFTDCGDPAELDAMLADRLLPLGVPILLGADVG